jgi:hypothetical protein
VPTVYSVGRSTIVTNQYAVTEQSKEISDHAIPGVFFKYDIEPILLAVHENRDNIFRLTFKIVNILSGVLVAAHWGFTISEWAQEVVGRRRRAAAGEGGFLGTKHAFD